MIAALTFGRPLRTTTGRTERPIAFASRSNLPLSAVCLVANGVRERFAQMLGRELEAEVVDPVIVAAPPASLLFSDAIVKRVVGRLCDVLVGVRRRDALALAGAAFGENERASEGLSQIERATVDRLLEALPPLCVPLCGAVRAATGEDPQRAICEAVTYFEVRFVGAVRATVAFALTADPREDVVSGLSLDDLGEVQIECAVECARGSVSLSALGAMTVGTTWVLQTPLGGAGTLFVGRVLFARGACGMRGERAAFVVDRTTAA